MTKVDLCMSLLCENQTARVICLYMELYIRRSNMLLQTCRRETVGQSDEIHFFIFIHLFLSWIGTIVTFFPSSGNIPPFRNFLKMICNGLHVEFPHSFNIRMLIMTRLWALLRSSFFNISNVVSRELKWF